MRRSRDRPLESIFSARADLAGELAYLRDRASRVIGLFVCFNVPIVGGVAISAGRGVEASIALALVLALAAVALMPQGGSSARVRLALAAVATAASVLVVSLARGSWHGDWFGYFFVVFALLVVFADWRPVALAALLTLGYVLSADASPRLWLTTAAFDRIAVQLFLVVNSCTILAVVSEQLRASMERTQAALSAREIFESIVVKGSAGMAVFTASDPKQRRLAYANPAFLELLGGAVDPIGLTVQTLVRFGAEGIMRHVAAGFRTDGRQATSVTWEDPDGLRHVELEMYPISTAAGEPYVVAVTTDITMLRRIEIESARAAAAEETNAALEREIAERKRAERGLAHAAHHDALTGLPNRLLLYERIELAVARPRMVADRAPAVIFIDLDGFKIVNDSFGHTVADMLLVAVARRCETVLRADDTIARIGGDEFVILLDQVSEESAATIGGLLLDEIRRPFDLDDRSIAISASIGIVIATYAHRSAEDLVRDADTAMYRAKTLGKGRCDVFVDDMRLLNQQRTRFGADLKLALAREEFTLHYQPIVSLVTGALEGFEALVRWQHPALGLVPPEDFISIAEETGSIVELGAWVLRAACAQLAAWRRELPGGETLTMSVNVSANQLLTPGYAASVGAMLAEMELDPTSLHVEITETAIVHEPLRVARELEQLRSFGVSISMDDFGTGYSSLTYLKAFPVDSLKIDRSFVSERGDSIGDPEIVRSLIVLAKSLGLSVVAEGVETPEQEAQLRELGCTKAQGYLFARPLTAVSATAFICGMSLSADVA